MEESNLTQAIRHLGAGKSNDDLHEFFPTFDAIMQSLQCGNIQSADASSSENACAKLLVISSASKNRFFSSLETENSLKIACDKLLLFSAFKNRFFSSSETVNSLKRNT